MRKVICCDAFEQLKRTNPVKAIVTSLPDASEVACGLSGYGEWFTNGVSAVLRSVTRDGIAILYQGDRKHDGGWLSKSNLISNAAHSLGFRLLWHKIALRNSPGVVNLYRPSYVHLMAFSATLKAGRVTPDVIDRSKTIYRNGMSISAALFAVRFAAERASTGVIYDPFCGRGTVLAVANALGYKSVGFDIDEGQCAYARALKITLPL